MTKFELPLAITYVPNWGCVEAFRELFQNALDNEIENPDNKMGLVYDEDTEVLSITNKTSSLSADSLLLGCSTKSNNVNTIGQHGEGYKIAFMVLLRNNKTVTVQNYGAKELWSVRLVNSKRYNNQPITTIFVDKAHIWKKVPDNDLTITVGGVTKEDWDAIVKSNLHLRKQEVECIECTNGRILTQKSEKGNIYVKGLFIHNNPQFMYGYDFEPRVISLDRDRKLVDTIKTSFETSNLWVDAASKSSKYKEIMTDMFYKNVQDVKYITESFTAGFSDARNALAEKFIEEHGEDAIPVSNDAEYNEVKDSGKTPVIVNAEVASAIKQSDYATTVVVEKKKSVKELFTEFMGEISNVLTDEQCKYMSQLIDKISN